MSFFPPLGPPGSSLLPQGSQAPTSAPPSFTPPRPLTSIYAVDPGGIAGCLFRFTFIWLENGQRFWFYPVFVGPTSIAGFRWTGRNWFYFGIDLRRVEAFSCY